jgi:hypothetical protein
MSRLSPAIIKLLIVGVFLTALSGVLPVGGRNDFCKQDSKFTLYNDVKRGLPLVYYKTAQSCGDIACAFKPGDPCQSDLKVLRREYKPVNFAVDVAFWILLTTTVYKIISRAFRK